MAPVASEAPPVGVVESLKTSRGQVNLDVFPDGLKSTGMEGERPITLIYDIFMCR